MNTAAICIDSGSLPLASSTLRSRVADTAAPSHEAAQPLAEVVEINVLPAASTTLSRTAVLGWASSTAAHVTLAAAAILWAVSSPEMPTLGGNTNNEPVTLEVTLSEPTPTESPKFEVKPAATKANATVEPHVEPVEHRDPTDAVDDTHRRYVVQDAPAAVSPPPAMARDDAQLLEEAQVASATSTLRTTRTNKVRMRSPAIFATAAEPVSLRITQHASANNNSKPAYPEEALARGLSGKVILRLHINTSGRVDKAEIHKSSGHTILDRAAASHALAHWNFHPARAGRGVVPQVIRVPVVFY